MLFKNTWRFTRYHGSIDSHEKGATVHGGYTSCRPKVGANYEMVRQNYDTTSEDIKQSGDMQGKVTQVEICGLAEGVSEDVVMMFFENEKRSGGGAIKRITMNSQMGTAVIQFESAEGKHVIFSSTVNILFGNTL